MAVALTITHQRDYGRSKRRPYEIVAAVIYQCVTGDREGYPYNTKRKDIPPMQIAGYTPNSFVDYPGNIAMTVFTAGCNMNCWYCHNAQLIRPGDTTVLYTEQHILAELERKSGFLDAVVISGGEPTLQSGLNNFIRQIKAQRYLVKLDTNGTRPNTIAALLEAGPIDYIAMDIKAPLGRYDEICRRSIDIEAIKESIDIIMSQAADYEFRTTLSPDLMAEDIAEIAHMISGAKRYTIQQYNPTERENRPPHTPSYIMQCANAAREVLDNVCVKGL